MTISNLVFRFILICDQAHVGLPRTRPHLCTLEASAPVGFIPNFEIEYQLLSVVDDSKYRTPREIAVAKSDIQPFPRGSSERAFLGLVHKDYTHSGRIPGLDQQVAN
jgi:hypothetical protein